MNKKIAIPTILFLIILPVSIFALMQEKNGKQPAVAQGNTAQNNADIVIYYSNACPHCKALEQWINDNGIKSKVNFSLKEVTTSQKNANELIEKAEICKIADGGIGVPFLWDGESGKCLMGDDEIEAFFKNKVGMDANNSTPQDTTTSENNTNTK